MTRDELRRAVVEAIFSVEDGPIHAKAMADAAIRVVLGEVIKEAHHSWGPTHLEARIRALMPE